MIELMIVVAIVAILAAIAYPSYAEHIRKSRRAQAKADLVELTQVMERTFTTDRTFANIDLAALNLNTSPYTGAARYTITLNPLAATTYTLTATPLNDQTRDRCGTLSIDQLGVKHHGGTGDDNTCGWGTLAP